MNLKSLRITKIKNIFKINLKMFSNSSPNILVTTNDDKEFQLVKTFLKSILGLNSYTIYKLASTELTKSLWMTNCALNIDIDSKNEIKHASFVEFLKTGGKLLTIPSVYAAKREANFEELTFHTADQELNCETDYKIQTNLVKEKLFEFEGLDEFIYYYPIHSGFHYVSKVLVKSTSNFFIFIPFF